MCLLHAVHVYFITLVAALDFVQLITGGAVILGSHGHCHGHDSGKVRMLIDLCPSHDNGEHAVWGVIISDFDQTLAKHLTRQNSLVDELQ